MARQMAAFAGREELSTITAKGQTTVPKSIRKALGVEAGDQIAFCIGEGGIMVRRVPEGREDRAVASFLSFLAQDIQRNPGNLKTLTPELAKQIAELVHGIEIDPDAPIEGDVAL